MPTLISRLYNFVNDKNNGIAITSSRVDAEFNQLVASMNQAVIIQATAPSSPVEGMLWYDSTNKLLKEYRNGEFVVMGVVHVSTTAPATPQLGDLWYKTNTTILQAWNGSAWQTFATLGVNVFTGTQKWAKGANVASASSITLGEDGNSFIISGTTTITSITIKSAGTVVILGFSGILTLTNGSNLTLASNLVTAAGTTIMLVSDGTNWNEVSRSPISFTQVGFGAWGATLSSGTIYQAATDGIVVAYTQTANNNSQLKGFTDSSNPPTTLRSAYSDATGASGSSYGSIMFPVRKNDYYQVTRFTSDAFAMYFLPLGS